MGQPFIGEIRMFGGNFAPAGWMFCAGQLLPIAENDALFNLIGTTYGGDGQSTFALPDLRGRIPVHAGNGFTLSQSGGVETVTLTQSQMPTHTHGVLSTSTGATGSIPNGAILASGPTMYVQGATANSTMAAAVSTVGGNQPHSNFQPYLCVDFIISLFGIFPSQT
jgi:microcystin-dependent protein